MLKLKSQTESENSWRSNRAQVLFHPWEWFELLRKKDIEIEGSKHGENRLKLKFTSLRLNNWFLDFWNLLDSIYFADLIRWFHEHNVPVIITEGWRLGYCWVGVGIGGVEVYHQSYCSVTLRDKIRCLRRPSWLVLTTRNRRGEGSLIETPAQSQSNQNQNLIH